MKAIDFPHALFLAAALGAAAWLPAHAAPTPVRGLITREFFANLPGTAVTDLTTNINFINDTPDSVSYLARSRRRSTLAPTMANVSGAG